MNRLVLVLLAALSLVTLSPSCGGTSKPRKTGKKTTKPAAGRIGAACKSEQPLGQGSCASGLICGPLPGGYCASMCPCGEGGACVESAKMGEMCLKSCASDADCRAGEGYVCHPQWKTCALPGLLSPPAPTCETPGATPAKKTFGPAEQISTADGPGKYHTEVAAALTKGGDVVAVYIAGTPFAPAVLGSSTVSAKGGVVGDNAIELPRDSHFDPWMAITRDGKIHLTYLGFDGARAPEKNMTIGLTTTDNGSTWTPPVDAFDVEGDCGGTDGCVDKPIIAIGPTREDPKMDAIYVLYYSAKNEALKIVRSTDGGKTWSPSAKVGAGAVADAEVTGSGKIHVAYVAGGGEMFGDTANHVEYVTSADGGATWSEPVRVSAEDDSVPVHFSSPQILADAKNAILYVAYPSGGPDGKWNIVLGASRDGGVTWQRTVVNDADGCSSHILPAAALDPKTGRVHVTWIDNRTGAGNLMYTSCAAGKRDKDFKCAANELVSDTPFASFGYARHATKWLGDYTTLIFDEKRRLLHAVWAQPVEEAGLPTSRIFHASARIK
jgi:hypothetical protein